MTFFQKLFPDKEPVFSTEYASEKRGPDLHAVAYATVRSVA
jgi:hypothetical protein